MVISNSSLSLLSSLDHVSGLAALTWWLRLQVVTFIAGRSLRNNYLEEITNNLLGQDRLHHVKVG